MYSYRYQISESSKNDPKSTCWTYSHHCQIADKNPSNRWNEEFRGFRMGIGWISTTRFFVVGFCVLD